MTFSNKFLLKRTNPRKIYKKKVKRICIAYSNNTTIIIIPKEDKILFRVILVVLFEIILEDKRQWIYLNLFVKFKKFTMNSDKIASNFQVRRVNLIQKDIFYNVY
jgi:hypothetical protein